MRGRKKRINPKHVMELLESGYFLSEIAQKYGAGETTLSDLCGNNNIDTEEYKNHPNRIERHKDHGTFIQNFMARIA